jgi:hypothetical protein
MFAAWITLTRLFRLRYRLRDQMGTRRRSSGVHLNMQLANPRVRPVKMALTVGECIEVSSWQG